MLNAPAFGADITNCGRESIHIPGSVQPHSALLAVDPQGLQIVRAGGNTTQMLGVAPVELLERNLADWFAPDRVARLRTVLANEGPLRPFHAFTIISKQAWEAVDAFVYRSGKLVVLELEPVRENSPENALALVQAMLAQVQQAGTSQAFCQGLAEEMRRASGFDRVMVYRLLPDGSGIIEAESRADGVESFLGLRYPASDIPRQARELYLNTWIQFIPNACCTPEPILSADNPRDGAPLDLSYSLIRSVSPMHLECLANMGVAASMSLSIIMDGRLWGLIACHHRTPRFLSHRLRMACELFAHMASAKLEARVDAEEFEAQLRSKRIHEDLLTRMRGEADLAEGLTKDKPNLLDYIPADGVGLWLDNRFTSLGQTPKAEQVTSLVAWLNERAAEGVFHTDRLPLLYPAAAKFAGIASGLIALSLSKTPRDYVLWFRPEVNHTVTWAGEPQKPAETVAGGQRVSSRKSCVVRREPVSSHSRPWRNVDVDAAKTLRLSLMEVTLRRIAYVARERKGARITQVALSAELNRRLERWHAIAAELKEEAQRRALVETEHSQMLRSTVEAEEAERRIVARELHDNLGQMLTLLQRGLDELGQSLPAGETMRERLAALKGLANGVGWEVNRLAWEIRPTALDDLGLETAIRRFIETWSERLNLGFDLRLMLNDRRLDSAIETTLYRVLQEAIANIARHANATRVALLLEASEKEVCMIVEDNGRGFSPAEAEPAGLSLKCLGLLGIRERLTLVSGTLEVEAPLGEGSTLYIRVPL